MNVLKFPKSTDFVALSLYVTFREKTSVYFEIKYLENNNYSLPFKWVLQEDTKLSVFWRHSALHYGYTSYNLYHPRLSDFTDGHLFAHLLDLRVVTIHYLVSHPSHLLILIDLLICHLYWRILQTSWNCQYYHQWLDYMK